MAKKKTFLLFTFAFLSFSIFSQNQPTITTCANSKYQKPFLYKIFLGWHYRKLWTTPIQAPVLYMDSIKGGLKLFDTAGDLQSVRLKFIDSSGNKFSFKMLDKDQSKFLSPFLRKTFIGYITRDLASALNPYSSMALSQMAPIMGIRIPTFNLYYLPIDTRYEQELKSIKGRLGYFYPSYKSHKKTLSTSKFFEKRFSKNNYWIDTIMFAKERLFNLLTGDFDRHRDQWDWGVSHKEDKEFITPLMKDYDMAFSKFRDGLLPFLITKVQPIMQQFNGKIKTKSMEKTGSYLDHLLLSGLTKDEWIVVADSIKIQLTDSIIISSLRNMPDEVFKAEGKRLFLSLTSRRDQLDKAAAEMYDILNKKVIIAGSDQSEKAIVTRINKNETLIKVVRLSKHGHEQIRFKRIFYSNETKSISIYLLGEDDEFEVHEFAPNKIKIKLYGGPQEDTYHIHGSKKIVIYDTKSGNNFNLNKRNKKKLSKKSTRFTFEREGY